MAPTRLLIFDLDGTLIDSLPDLTDATNLIRSNYGLPEIGIPEVRKLVGQGARNLVERALPGATAAQVDQALGVFLDYNLAHIADKTRPYPGVSETLKELRNFDIPMVVLSNKNVALCREVLAKLAIGDAFAEVFGADSFPYRKPSPEPVLAVLKQYKIEAAECVMVGDSINDIAAGLGAGVFTVGCSYGYGEVSELAGANYQVSDFQSLLNLPFFNRKSSEQ
ncbi:HAD superfamily hydrolase [Citrifermentans bemidjiense Bem]|uniref:phosphoglycolate phosphatase n=1 Tax=Citrifermentans bemidjiense (strain ATCC BAA-1014 / DSM 16622 / JCM 12645 / Bem) TaxID=404380 RepID=B5EE54_CITBB|nr:HAD-IIIA family hydrolase [Citrifermentans bemidjiense]ACH37792.1 HAD superfamily hydrolase [Citrifermentans bemidjiense Bem]